MLGLCSLCLRQSGGKGWALRMSWTPPPPGSCFCGCFCKNRFGLRTRDVSVAGAVLWAVGCGHRDLTANTLGSLPGRTGGQERSRSCDFDTEFASSGNLKRNIFFLCETARKYTHGKHILILFCVGRKALFHKTAFVPFNASSTCTVLPESLASGCRGPWRVPHAQPGRLCCCELGSKEDFNAVTSPLNCCCLCYKSSHSRCSTAFFPSFFFLLLCVSFVLVCLFGLFWWFLFVCVCGGGGCCWLVGCFPRPVQVSVSTAPPTFLRAAVLVVVLSLKRKKWMGKKRNQ